MPERSPFFMAEAFTAIIHFDPAPVVTPVSTDVSSAIAGRYSYD